MGKKTLKHFSLVGIDTNVFIYHFQQHPEFNSLSEKLFNLLAYNKIQAITSIITLIELLAYKESSQKIKTLREEFLSTPNLITMDINQEIGFSAAEIRREYGFRLPDALQLATCMHANAKAFITNDSGLKSFKKIKILNLKEI